MPSTTFRSREATLVTDRRVRPMMGLPVWEALPAPGEVRCPFSLASEKRASVSVS